MKLLTEWICQLKHGLDKNYKFFFELYWIGEVEKYRIDKIRATFPFFHMPKGIFLILKKT